jgi:hypothetical protein
MLLQILLLFVTYHLELIYYFLVNLAFKVIIEYSRGDVLSSIFEKVREVII